MVAGIMRSLMMISDGIISEKLFEVEEKLNDYHLAFMNLYE